MRYPYGHLIRILHSSSEQAMTIALEEVGLTAAQGHLLGHLTHHQDSPQYPRDIEEAFHLSHATVAGLLDRLEKKGFVELQTDPDDRRRRRIVPTEKAREFTQRVGQILDENEEKMLRGFSEKEQERFASYLQRAIHNVGGGKRCVKKEERKL